jgi:hypothetical protein
MEGCRKNCGLRNADCGLDEKSSAANPQFEIRNPQFMPTPRPGGSFATGGSVADIRENMLDFGNA